MSLRPGKYDLFIAKGATFAIVFTWNIDGDPVDLTNYTARMQIRSTKESSAVMSSLTTENGGISLGGSAGTISLSLTASATSLLIGQSGVYDIELVSGEGVVYRLLEGVVTLSNEVTR